MQKYTIIPVAYFSFAGAYFNRWRVATRWRVAKQTKLRWRVPWRWRVTRAN
jgi:hypothetical protein